MKVTMAAALGTCFGVNDAIEEALNPHYKGKLTIIGQLVHNPQTVQKLREHGVQMVDSFQGSVATPYVMITAHGAPASLKEKATTAGYQVLDASCPLVLRVHSAVAKLVEEGYFPVVIGEEKHVEVRGIVGDLKEYVVIGSDEDIKKLQGRDKIGVVCQTTQQLERTQSIVGKIKEMYPNMEVRFVDTICKPTKDRQIAVKELAEQVDLMIVVGGYNSSNTKKLKSVCDKMGVEAHHIERVDELQQAWFQGKQHVGVTAGTSTPREVILEVFEAIKAI